MRSALRGFAGLDAHVPGCETEDTPQVGLSQRWPRYARSDSVRPGLPAMKRLAKFFVPTEVVARYCALGLFLP